MHCSVESPQGLTVKTTTPIDIGTFISEYVASNFEKADGTLRLPFRFAAQQWSLNLRCGSLSEVHAS
jgi:hypothetical protein